MTLQNVTNESFLNDLLLPHFSHLTDCLHEAPIYIQNVMVAIGVIQELHIIRAPGTCQLKKFTRV